MLSIDEAIKHEEKFADSHDRIKQIKAVTLEECIRAAEHRQIAEWLKELKSLKEKDEAKAARYEGDGYADGAMVYDAAFCPNCEHEFEEDSENWGCEFCPSCGQRLRWERMTGEEAIRELKKQFVGEYYRQREAKDMAIKALEQEPILDKIRAELIDVIQNGTLKLECGNETLFNIIDKYRAGNEEEEE